MNKKIHKIALKYPVLDSPGAEEHVPAQAHKETPEMSGTVRLEIIEIK